MKRNNIRTAILWTCACTLAACSDNMPDSTTDTKVWDIDQNMDAAFTPGDNFYMYCIGTWHKNMNLGSQQSYLKLNDPVYDQRVKALDDDPTIKQYYDHFATIDQTTEYAYAAIKKMADEVTANITTTEDAWKAVGKAIQRGYTPFFTLDVTIKDGVMYTILQPTRIPVPQTVQGVKQTLLKIGVTPSHAETAAKEVVAVQNKLAGLAHGPDFSISNLEKHPELFDELVARCNTVTRAGGHPLMGTVLTQLGIEEKNIATASVRATYLDSLQQLTVDQIKYGILNSIADDYMIASSKDLTEYNQAHGTDFTFEAIAEVYRKYLNYNYSHAYATRYCIPEQKTKWISVCEDMRAVFKERINALDWMSSTTKRRATEKLEAMHFNVLYPDQWVPQCLTSLADSRSWVEDIQRLRMNFCYTIPKYVNEKTTISEGFFLMATWSDLSTTNAFYNSMFNAMFIYPAIVSTPMYDEKNSDASMYACATIIGHEITHGFDSNGANYDKIGNYKNWWTTSDKMDFVAKQQLLINCFNSLEIMPDELPGVYANGTRTLGENIADLGGVEMAHQCYLKKLTEQGYFGDEMIKQEKRFYQAYADLWRSKYTTEYANFKLGTDVHSLPKERINGVLMNCDRWYELYNVKWGDLLYLKPEMRCHIW